MKVIIYVGDEEHERDVALVDVLPLVRIFKSMPTEDSEGKTFKFMSSDIHADTMSVRIWLEAVE